MLRLYEYLKIIGYMIGIILIFTFLITILNYFNILSTLTISYLKLIIVLITAFSSGILVGKSSIKKGWLEGLKLGISIVVLMILFSYLGLGKSLAYKNIIYYIIIIITTILGGMIGINRKKPVTE
ncbi:MAG: TIGR04086 family membrane protein [Bacilli bacterium]|nr:TIGR04086 family membrane protein [Bacilli bacterium]